MAKKKVKIYWGRIIAAVTLLIAVIMILVLIIRSIFGAFANDDDSSVPFISNSSKAAVETEKLKLKVFLDPGHGGEEDPGATNFSETRLEKDDNLNIALLVRDELESRGVTVYMSRDTDKFLELDEIVRLANATDADMFVSLHRNSNEGGNGMEAWVNWNAPKADTLLAQNIIESFNSDEISDNRGVWFGYTSFDYTVHVNYQVNEQTKMPSCLLELGFITDDGDNALFDKYIDSYAKCIADGIVKTSYQLGIDKDPTGMTGVIDLDLYSYEGAPETVDIDYTAVTSEPTTTAKTTKKR